MDTRNCAIECVHASGRYAETWIVLDTYINVCKIVNAYARVCCSMDAYARVSYIMNPSGVLKFEC